MALDLFDSLFAIVAELERVGIEHALVGGLAVAVHGAPRATTDIDLLVEPGRADDAVAAAKRLGFAFEALPLQFADGMRLGRNARTRGMDIVADDDIIGRVIDGRYRVGPQIGIGGMGVVHRCQHIRLGKDLAIKILRRDQGHSTDLVARFVKEARIASSIKHANVVDLSDAGEMESGGAYYVMELLRGESLADVLEKRRRLSPTETFEIVQQISAGLAAAHVQGIVHRDLKPENVFLCEGHARPHVKLLDFGIARVSGSRDTLPGSVLGTPEYMAPGA